MITPEVESRIKSLSNGQQAQACATLAALAVIDARLKSTITREQGNDILRQAIFAAHLLSTHATLETLAKVATSDEIPIEIAVIHFMHQTHAQIGPALEQLQNLLTMMPIPEGSSST